MVSLTSLLLVALVFGLLIFGVVVVIALNMNKKK